jgi:S1-C subfamily serine protease
MKKEEIYKLNLAKKSRSRSYFTKSSSGTATLIARKKQAFLFLTCKHILDYPDTVYYYYTDSEGALTDIIKSVAIKVRQSNQIPELGEVIDVISDEKLDVALVGYIQPKQFVTEKKPTVESLRPIEIPLGQPDRLQVGSFVYVIGYPQGIKMITSGLVSIYHTAKGKKILLDVLFNQGASGAIVLAIMDGVPNFELIGIANAVSAEDEFYLIPEKGKDWDPTVEYKGKMYVRHRKLINYGITFIISIDKIYNFMKKYKREIIRRGFPVPELEKNIYSN